MYKKVLYNKVKNYPLIVLLKLSINELYFLLYTYTLYSNIYVSTLAKKYAGYPFTAVFTITAPETKQLIILAINTAQ